MPRTRDAALSTSSGDALRPDALDLDLERSYSEILAEAGARRGPNRTIVHDMPIGAPYKRGTRWLQDTKTFPVAMSAEEARDKTRATGERWDYFEPGVICDACIKVDPGFVLSGWVLGGRKFQAEHAHVTNFDPSQFGTIEVDPPAATDDDDEALASMEA